MKPNKSSSQTPFMPDSPHPDYSASLIDCAPALPVQVPTVQELAAHLSGQKEHPMLTIVPQNVRTGQASLLQGLLGGNTDALLDDHAREPDRYSAPVGGFLSAFPARAPGALTPDETRLLDMAVLEFAAAPKPVPPEAMKPKPQPLKPKPQTMESVERGRPWEDAAPDNEPELYWWLK